MTKNIDLEKNLLRLNEIEKEIRNQPNHLNQALGLFEEAKKIIKESIDYLEAIESKIKY